MSEKTIFGKVEVGEQFVYDGRTITKTAKKQESEWVRGQQWYFNTVEKIGNRVRRCLFIPSQAVERV